MKIDRVIEVLEELNCKDIVVYDFEKKSPFFDYFIIATTNTRQANAAAIKLKDINDIEIKSIEGKNSPWTLIDLGDVVIHMFDKENREFYRFEKRFIDIKQYN